MGFVIAAPAGQCRVNRALIDPVVARAANALVEAFKTEQEGAESGLDIVLPGIQVLLGAEKAVLDAIGCVF